MKALATLLALALSVAAYGAQLAEIKGLHLGMTPAQVNALHPQLQCSEGDECYLDTTTVSGEFDLRKLGDLDVRNWELHFVDGKLAKVRAILFQRHDDELAAAFAEKYGKPRDIAVPMSNGFGAKYVWHIQEWRLPGGTISLVKTGSDTFPTSVDLAGALWKKHQADQEKADAKRRAGGL